MLTAGPVAAPTPACHDPYRDLFAYGTLMCAEIMAEVAGKRLPYTPAVLTGYRRFLVRGEQYPGVVDDPAGTVSGLVYHDIDATGWRRLDRFEGEMYQRRPVTVQLAGGGLAQVDCYVIRSAFLHRLTRTEWDYTAFLLRGKRMFQQQYFGFKAID